MRRSLPILILLVGLLALWGCSKKNPTQATNQPQEQAFGSESQTNAVRATGFVGSFSGGLGSTPGKPTAEGSPTFLPPIPTLSPPDTSWHGPGRNLHQPGDTTWYYKPWTWQDTSGSFSDTVYVKFKPNIWDTAQHRPDTVKVTRVDWEGLIYWANTSRTIVSSIDESAWASYSSDTTKIDGEFKVVGSLKNNNAVVSSYAYQFSWTNCTRSGWTGIPRTCSGTITWTATSYWLATAQNYSLSGSYTFTNGTGTGEAKLSNVTFAKFTFNSNGSGDYTLLSENWQIHHPFFW